MVVLFVSLEVVNGFHFSHVQLLVGHCTDLKQFSFAVLSPRNIHAPWCNPLFLQAAPERGIKEYVGSSGCKC